MEKSQVTSCKQGGRENRKYRILLIAKRKCRFFFQHSEPGNMQDPVTVKMLNSIKCNFNRHVSDSQGALPDDFRKIENVAIIFRPLTNRWIWGFNHLSTRCSQSCSYLTVVMLLELTTNWF